MWCVPCNPLPTGRGGQKQTAIGSDLFTGQHREDFLPVRRSQSGAGVPAGAGVIADLVGTDAVAAGGDVVQRGRVGVEDRVDEAWRMSIARAIPDTG